MAITKPTVGQDADTWGTTLNTALDSLQTQIQNATDLSLAIGNVTQGAAAAAIRGTAPNLTLDLTLPQGAAGAAPNLAIGTVTTGAAAATITGTSPNLTLNLTVPVGPSGTVSVGSVTTGAAGSSATVTNSGTSTNAVLDFTIPKGDSGTGSVSSVNGVGPSGGNVTLTAANVGAVSTSALAAPNGVATLAADGTIPTSQIPALALVTAVPVASQAAMLALTSSQVQPGDVAVRSDGAGTFMLTATPPSTLANWTLLNAPTDKVTSVNSQVGTVNLAASDVGAAPVTRAITAGTGLTGGGDLSADRTLAVSYGTASGTAAQGNDSRITGAAQKASNLSDLASAATARTNLGLGGAAVLSVGTTVGTVAAGDDSRVTGAVQKSVATTKGDMFVATGSATVTRLGVGSDTQVLTADSTQAGGVKWAAAGGTPGALTAPTSYGTNCIAASSPLRAAQGQVSADGGYVDLSGAVSVSGTTTNGQVICTFPTALRPSVAVVLPGYIVANTGAQASSTQAGLLIGTDGTVKTSVATGNTGQSFSLEGIRYRL